MNQTISCRVLLSNVGTLFILSDRPRGPHEHKFTYGGQPIEAAEDELPGVQQIPASQLEKLREQARSKDRKIVLELVDEYSGGDPVPFERPYWPWDLEPAPPAEAKGSGVENELPF